MGTGRVGAEPVWFTVDEAAETLRVGRDTVLRWVKTGEIPSRRFGSVIRIPYSAVYPADTPTAV